MVEDSHDMLRDTLSSLLDGGNWMMMLWHVEMSRRGWLADCIPEHLSISFSSVSFTCDIRNEKC